MQFMPTEHAIQKSVHVFYLSYRRHYFAYLVLLPLLCLEDCLDLWDPNASMMELFEGSTTAALPLPPRPPRLPLPPLEPFPLVVSPVWPPRLPLPLPLVPLVEELVDGASESGLSESLFIAMSLSSRSLGRFVWALLMASLTSASSSFFFFLSSLYRLTSSIIKSSPIFLCLR